MSRHLVTGGAGFIGAALSRRLLAQGHEVRVLDRFSRGKHSRLPDGIETFTGDIRDAQIVNRAVAGCDTVWHLAYVQGTQTFYANPRDVIDVALTGIMNVLNACAATEVKRDFFLLSSSEVYQNPPAHMYPTDETVPLSVPDVTNPRYSYGGGKIASELATLAYAQAGVFDRAVIVRPHNIYGPDMGFEHVIPEFAVRMRQLKRKGGGSFPIQGTGRETRSFCYIQDAVDGLITLLDHGASSEVYHLGNPAEEYEIMTLAERMAEWFEMEIQTIPGALPKGSPIRRVPDIGKMRALGYEPHWSLSQGLAHTLPWYAMNQQLAA